MLFKQTQQLTQVHALIEREAHELSMGLCANAGVLAV